MRNNFDKSVFFFWMDNRICWWCGLEVTLPGSALPGERIDALHHILGRVSNSILNSAPIHNFCCHLNNGQLNKRETVRRFLRQTHEYLIAAGYKFKKKDQLFLEQHRELYTEIQT